MRLSWAGAPAGRAPSRRLNTALLGSLLVHALLLSLTFGQGEGLPGLSLPWQARRGDAPDLRVLLQAEPGAVAPLPLPRPDVERPADSATPPATAQADDVASLKTLLPAGVADDISPTAPIGPPRLTAQRPDMATWAVAAASAVPTAVVATLPAASSPSVEALRCAGDALRAPSDRETRETGERAVELAQLDAERQQAKAAPAAVIAAFASASSPAVEPLRRAAESLRAPADRERAVDLAQLDSARLDAQQSAQRLEAARQEAARAEAARQDAARQEAARQDAARAEAGRQEAARQAAAKAAAQLEAGRIEAAKLAAVQAEAEQREARLRAIGKQLDEEAVRRDAARQQPNWTPARRGRLFGRTDANDELVLYAEAWARKIQLNMAFELAREAVKQPHTDPIVTVAVRSDGSVESITFVRSSGVPAVDDAVRRIVQSQEHYPAFSPALLRDYDVVEIRRTWHFDMAIRLY